MWRVVGAAATSVAAWLVISSWPDAFGAGIAPLMFLFLAFGGPLLGTVWSLPALDGHVITRAGCAAAIAGPLMSVVLRLNDMSYDNNAAVVTVGAGVWLLLAGGLGSLKSWGVGAMVNGWREPTVPRAPSH